MNSNSTCSKCTLSNCLDCGSLTACLLCDSANMYFLNSSTNQCYFCNSSINLFVNASSTMCELCTLAQCTKCQSLTQCSQCNEVAGFFINSADSLCYPCSVSNCITCQTLTTCKVCDTANNYGVVADGTCKQCPFTCTCDGYVLPKYVNQTDGVTYCSTMCGDGMKRNF